MANYSSYYNAPTYGEITPKINTCLTTQGTVMRITDISYWGTSVLTDIDTDGISLKITMPDGTTEYNTTIGLEPIVKTGTVSGTGGGFVVTGVLTLFTTEFEVGGYIYIDDLNKAFKIASIASDTSLVVETFLTDTFSGSDIYLISDYVDIPISSIDSNLIYPDGLYTFEYAISVSGTEYTSIQQNYFYYNVEACTHQLVSTLTNYCSEFKCNHETINRILMTNGVLESLKIAVLYCDFTNADILQSLLDDLCNQLNCNCNN